MMNYSNTKQMKHISNSNPTLIYRGIEHNNSTNIPGEIQKQNKYSQKIYRGFEYDRINEVDIYFAETQKREPVMVYRGIKNRGAIL